MERETWKTTRGFLLAAIGSAIGLGNIWRFPYIASKNGGGAFLIPYLIALFICGIPLLIMEFSIGHKLRGSAPSVFERIKTKKGKSSFQFIGWLGVTLAMFGIMTYYAVVLAWCFYYLLLGLGLVNIKTLNPSNFFMSIIGEGSFFTFNSPYLWIVICIIIIWLLNAFFILKGVEKGVEKANKIFMPLLFIITLILIIRSIFLPGAGNGIKTYLIPDLKKLLDGNVWKDAFSQIFFTLSLSFGIMIVYASYLPRKENLKKSAFITSLTNCGYEIIVGFLVFSVIGYAAQIQNISVEKALGSGGVGMAFISFPLAIQKMGSFAEIFWILFFLCLIFAGITSSLSLLEAFVASIKDKFNVPRKKATLITVFIGFLLSIIFTLKRSGVNWIDAVDHAMNNYGLIGIGILNCLIIGWIYKAKILRRHIYSTDGKKIGLWWEITIKYIAASSLFIIFIWGVYTTIIEKSLEYILIGLGWLSVIIITTIILTKLEWKNIEALKLGHHFDDNDNPLPIHKG